VDARAAVQVGDRAIEVRALPIPDDLGEDGALLAIEANGICGTDLDQYNGALAAHVPYPVVAGHEIVGRLERVGDRAARRWGVGPGDRVAVESTVPCGACPNCRSGRWLACSRRVIYGLNPLADEPGLSGGNAEYLVLRPNSMVYPLPDHVGTQDAAFFNALGSGFDWGVRLAGTTVGDTVVIVGPGQRGLACVVAAADAGAERIVVAGRGGKPWKFEAARALGATAVVNVDEESLVDVVQHLTGGAMADRVIDTTPAGGVLAVEALRCARPEGTVVWGAAKPDLTGDASRLVVSGALTVRGAYSVSPWAKRQAIAVLAAGRHDLSMVHTHTFSFGELDRAMAVFAGHVDGEEAVHVTIVPERT
jgi:threonine dehydrogenase-like Zn-dependent dehydrogenase